MGAEAICVATYRGATAETKALLETDELVLRGALKLRVKLADLRDVVARDGTLRARTPDGALALALGAQAAKWADKILHPPTLVDKLGVKPTARVSVIGVTDAAALAQIEASGADVSRRPRKGSDVILVQIDEPAQLSRIASQAGNLGPRGTLWVVHPKGRQDLRDTDVMAAGRKAGLVDNKTARFSATHTALRFVVPKAKR